MKKIVLFDMDGTLTPPRKRMQWNVIDALHELQSANFEIGIVTGSDINYVEQQCDLLFDVCPVNCFEIHYLPCNGTKYYKMDGSGFLPIYERNMRNKIGEDSWRDLNKLILSLQSTIASSYDIPLAGNYVSYRGSMINWCPIGRLANDEDREEWARCEKRLSIRNNWLHIARQCLNNKDLEDIVIKLGGETSFDIYPEGWDKTYAFNNFKDYDIYFVGDRCDRYGNDREAYLMAGEKGYATSGPEETVKIIQQIIKEA